MKLFSKFALMLSVGSLALMPAAYAKDEKKGKEAAAGSSAPKLKPSKAFVTAYGPANDALEKKKDVVLAKSLYPGLKAAATTEDDKYVLGSFAIALGVQAKDVALQKEGIDLLIASPLTPAANKPLLTFQKGAFAYDSKDFVTAEGFFKQAFDAGYNPPNTALLLSDSLGRQKKYAEALPWVRKAIDLTIAAGAKPDAGWYRQGASYAVNAKDNAASNIWLKELVRADGQPKYWHDALSIYGQTTNLDLQENLDIMRLMRAVGAMSYSQDYGLYVESADARRYPSEVVAVLDEGFTKGTIARQNANFAEAYKTASSLAAEDKRSLPGTEAATRASATAYPSVLTADAYLSQGNYAKAKEFYELALTKGKIVDKSGVDQTARAQTRLAISKAYMGDYAGAKADFAKIQSGNRKGVAEYWTIYVDSKLQPATVAPLPAAK
jgi:tetratricopeptide (TPR) repeat protein